jgi:hypothetical protein
VRILWKLKPKTIGSGLSYEMRVIRNVNRLHINNLGPRYRGDSVEISVNFNMKTMNIYIYIYNSLFSVDIRVLSFISK